MPNRFLTLIWGLLAALAVFFGIRTYLDFGLSAPVIAALVALVLATLAVLLVPAVRHLLAQLLDRLRATPALYWLVLLVYLVLWISRWLVLYQPTAGWWITPIEFAYFFTGLWGLLFLLAYGFSSAQARTMAQKVGKSRLTGLLITLTTILVIFFLAEAYLRLFYITTDGYGFTAMNYHWYKNYGWAQDNSLGYRDHEPRPDAPGLIRIAVVGDSFAMGHGINNLDDTFAQILERRLGDCCDVDLLAESGWDTDLELPFLEQYPYPPNIVVLSYYLNDIDYLLTDTAQDPNANFAFVK
ncbi:MAG: SGNH/GDSL hydrolase family protein, partial [Anaerolineae bacterium]|nr:SGNH/GDSL hydrolase family protein [Anaerolineae bacterium]